MIMVLFSAEACPVVSDVWLGNMLFEGGLREVFKHMPVGISIWLLVREAWQVSADSRLVQSWT